MTTKDKLLDRMAREAHGTRLQMARKMMAIAQVARTVYLKITGTSDVTRWRADTNLNRSWDTRTELLASFIAPGSAVLEFGAGRQVLPRYLPAGCTYTPSDLVDRGNGTLVCDLNAGQLPPFSKYDVIVFSGVLEYVHDLPRLVRHLRGCCREIVASYAVTDFAGQDRVFRRRRHGWVNDYPADDLKALFADAGFECWQEVAWNAQCLYRFVRVATQEADSRAGATA